MQYHFRVEDSFILAMCDTLPDLPPEIPAEILGPSAWYGPDLTRSPDWIEYLSSTETAEVEKRLAFESRDITSIRKGDFPLPTLAPRLRSLSRGVSSYGQIKNKFLKSLTRATISLVGIVAMQRSAVEDDDENYSWSHPPFRRPREWEGLSQIDCYEIGADGLLGAES